MDKKYIKEQATLELAKELLQESDDEMFDADDFDEEDNEESEESNSEEDNHRENDEEDKKKQHKDEGIGKNKSSTTKPKGKKQSKGMKKMLKSLMGVVSNPFDSKTKWNFDFNLGVKASNHNDQRDANADKKVNKFQNPMKSGQLSQNDKKIAILENEIQRLRKIAKKFLDECMRLKTKVEELSEVDTQLLSVNAENKQLKEELLEQEKLRQSMKSNIDTQTENHGKEIKKLDVALKKAADDFAKLKLKNQQQDDEINRLKKELEDLSLQNANLKKESSGIVNQHRLEVKLLNERLQNEDSEKSELKKHNEELNTHLQQAVEQTNEANAQNAQLHQKLRELENDKNEMARQCETSTAKVSELRRAIQILESNSFTVTTAHIQRDRMYSCPICGAQFASMADMRLHAEDCGV